MATLAKNIYDSEMYQALTKHFSEKDNVFDLSLKKNNDNYKVWFTGNTIMKTAKFQGDTSIEETIKTITGEKGEGTEYIRGKIGGNGITKLSIYMAKDKFEKDIIHRIYNSNRPFTLSAYDKNHDLYHETNIKYVLDILKDKINNGRTDSTIQNAKLRLKTFTLDLKKNIDKIQFYNDKKGLEALKKVYHDVKLYTLAQSYLQQKEPDGSDKPCTAFLEKPHHRTTHEENTRNPFLF